MTFSTYFIAIVQKRKASWICRCKDFLHVFNSSSSELTVMVRVTAWFVDDKTLTCLAAIKFFCGLLAIM